MTERNKVLLETAELNVSNPEVVLKAIEKELNKLKHASFGKVKTYSKSKAIRKLETLQHKKVNLINNKHVKNKDQQVEQIDSEIAAFLEEMQSSQFEKDVVELKHLKYSKGQAAATFKLRDKLLGNKKTAQEQVFLIDNETGEEVYDHEEIKNVALKYCVKLLTNREPKTKYKDIIETKNELHRIRMKKELENVIEDFEHEVYEEILNKLKLKKNYKV